MDDEQAKFMRELAKWSGSAEPRQLGILASRAQDRARQKAKRSGWVVFKHGYWRLTESGYAELRK
jgi:hypothetical protein